VVGFIGAWIGGALLHIGPTIEGIQIIPAIVGAALFVFLLRLIMGAFTRNRGTVVHP
jgi:uncharacterized membrane protein YeaQ/YmgE (transglycosylase-associated protein family)